MSRCCRAGGAAWPSSVPTVEAAAIEWFVTEMSRKADAMDQYTFE